MVLNFLISALLLATFNSQSADFRRSYWGDQKTEVRRNETAGFHHERDHELAYFFDEIPGVSGALKYYFKENKLTEGVYLSRNLHEKVENYYHDYQTVQAFFDKQLGKHLSEEWQWADEAHRSSDTSQIAQSIWDNKLKIISHWEYGLSQADLVIEARKGRIGVRVFFKPAPGMKTD